VQAAALPVEAPAMPARSSCTVPGQS
jgi:hypothetical protein